MKAIMIFEINDDIDLNRCTKGGDNKVYYDRLNEPRSSIVGKSISSFIPLPEKKTDSSYAITFGWNSCIDEILKHVHD